MAAALVALALSAPAAAETLSAPAASDRDCAAGLRDPGARAADRAAFTSPGRGYVTARLRGGRRGDWDLAAYRRSEAVGASNAIGSNERVDLLAERGQRFVF